MRIKIILITIAIFSTLITKAQSVGIGTLSPNASSQLDITSTNKGLLIPRMTLANRASITSPANGLLVYITDDNSFYYNSGTPVSPNWTKLITTVSSSSGWNLTGNGGTNPITDFLGTTDAQPLMIKLNNRYAGTLNSNTFNYFIGDSAGVNTLAGIKNIALGPYALYTNIDGENNIAIGDSAAYKNKSNNIIAIGKNALKNRSTSGSNSPAFVAIGTAALQYQTSAGQGSVAIGDSVLSEQNGGGATVAIGIKAMQKATAFNTVAIGYEAVQSATSGNNVGIGFRTMLNVLNGNDNVAIGSQALYGRSIVFNGGGAFPVRTIAIGGSTLANTISTTDNIAIGHLSMNKNENGLRNIAMGTVSLYSNLDMTNNMAIGDSSMYKHIGNISNSVFGFNLAIGNNSMKNYTEGYYNMAIGYKSLYGINAQPGTGIENVALGHFALQNSYAGSGNVAVGMAALNKNILTNFSVAVGDSSMYNAVGHSVLGLFSNAVGAGTLLKNTTGHNNNSMGYKALYNNTTGAYNAVLGNWAMHFNKNGNNNVAIGREALMNADSGSANIAIGSFALTNGTGGDNNISVGYQTLQNLTTGNRNVVIGNSAGLTVNGNNNIVIGSDADLLNITLNNATTIGYNSTVANSNSMAFGNSNVTSWSFGRSSNAAGNALQVGTIIGSNGNGAYLTIGGVWTNTSDQNLKTNIKPLDNATILEKIKQLKITQWDYKNNNETHIGPMAQQFKQLFGLGIAGDDKAISTIDPSGVALAAIQQLAKENEELRKQIETLRKMVMNK